eukprot:3728757-Pyramimonas_sp.AAC.1
MCLLERDGHRAEQNYLVGHGQAVVVDVTVMDPAPSIHRPYLGLKYTARDQRGERDKREDAARRDPAGFGRKEPRENGDHAPNTKTIMERPVRLDGGGGGSGEGP